MGHAVEHTYTQKRTEKKRWNVISFLSSSFSTSFRSICIFSKSFFFVILSSSNIANHFESNWWWKNLKEKQKKKFFFFVLMLDLTKIREQIFVFVPPSIRGFHPEKIEFNLNWKRFSVVKTLALSIVCGEMCTMWKWQTANGMSFWSIGFSH